MNSLAATIIKDELLNKVKDESIDLPSKERRKPNNYKAN
jgi:hypothetical protein